MKQSNYDLVIIGAGPAGLASALSTIEQARINHKKLRVLMVDASDGTRQRIGESTIAELLVPLSQLGLLNTFRADEHKPSPGNVSVWGDSQPTHKDFLLNPMGPAWRLNRSRFDNMLIEALTAHDIEICWQTKFEQLLATHPNQQGYQLLFSAKNGEKWVVDANFVVDASGPRAHFARSLGIKIDVHDKMFALARFANISEGNMTMQTWLEATETGWWYAAKLPDQRALCMFVGEVKTVNQMKINDHLGWQQQLNNSRLVGPTLAQLKLSDEKFHGIGIVSSILQQCQGNNWLAVGDAVACYDPITAHGLYKALRDGVNAGKIICGGRHERLYQQSNQAKFEQYYHYRHYLYGLEQRWSDATFWQNRANSHRQFSRSNSLTISKG